MNALRRVTLAGFAIFSMIFGSGNIVFPLMIGKNFDSNWEISNLGWLAATVFIPLMGYFGAMLFDADTKKYLKPFGKHLTATFLLVIMLMVGPFGVVARGINVSFGGIHIVAPNIPEWIFNSVYVSITILLAWNSGKIVQLLGVVFTPLKFGGVALIVLGALYYCNLDIPKSEVSRSIAFTEGFKMGYQTLDLLAAFIMSSSIYLYIKNSLPENERENKKQIIKLCGYACIIGGTVLAIVYTGLSLVGAKYSVILQETADEALFTKIAEVAMGNYASWFVAIVIAACCLATNIILSSAFTDYVYKDILKERFNRSIVLVMVGVVTIAMSFLGFSKLCSLMGLILEKLYPVIIIFVIARITHYYAKGAKRE